MLLKEVIIVSRLIQKTKNAGKIQIVSVYHEQGPVPHNNGGTSTYSDKHKNLKKAAKNLNLKIALNFDVATCRFITISLLKPYCKDMSQAKKLKRKIIRFIENYYKDQGLDFKTVGSIERGKKRTKRLHFHLLIPEITFSKLNIALRKKFKNEIGCIYSKRAYEKEENDNMALAFYLLKNRKESDEFEVSIISHNLQTVDVDTHEIKSCENPFLELKHTGRIEAPKGYTWDKKQSFLNSNEISEPTGTTRFNKI